MGKIVAIGGGEIGLGETDKIDKYLVSLTNKENPKLLFIPTASQDAEGYINNVDEHFGKMGCIVDSLCIETKKYSDEEIQQLIFSSDVIYVGGGDTVRMMEKWREYNVDQYLIEAYQEGIVLSGLSAGSICWFKFGDSESDSFVNDGQWDYIRAYGVGLIPAAHCPHYNEEGRESFDQMMLEEDIPGIALEDRTAFVEVDGKYSIYKDSNQAKAYIIFNEEDKQIKKELEHKEEVQLDRNNI